MKKISAVLITFNEEARVGRALESLADVSDDIVVVDSFSRDRTLHICSAFTSKIIQRQWNGYRDQKEFATQQAQNDWVLSLDADEELSPELRREILEFKRDGGDGIDGFYLPRRTFFLGRWIDHTTWYPDWQMRLFRRSCGGWAGGSVHEAFQLKGRSGRFRGHLQHYSYESLSEYLQKLDEFSSLAARDRMRAGERTRFTRFLLYPPAAFLKNYALRRGFLDGFPGFAVSALAAVSALFKELKLWELQHHDQRESTLGPGADDAS